MLYQILNIKTKTHTHIFLKRLQVHFNESESKQGRYHLQKLFIFTWIPEFVLLPSLVSPTLNSHEELWDFHCIEGIILNSKHSNLCATELCEACYWAPWGKQETPLWHREAQRAQVGWQPLSCSTFAAVSGPLCSGTCGLMSWDPAIPR